MLSFQIFVDSGNLEFLASFCTFFGRIMHEYANFTYFGVLLGYFYHFYPEIHRKPEFWPETPILAAFLPFHPIVLRRVKNRSFQSSFPFARR